MFVNSNVCQSLMKLDGLLTIDEVINATKDIKEIITSKSVTVRDVCMDIQCINHQINDMATRITTEEFIDDAREVCVKLHTLQNNE